MIIIIFDAGLDKVVCLKSMHVSIPSSSVSSSWCKCLKLSCSSSFYRPLIPPFSRSVFFPPPYIHPSLLLLSGNVRLPKKSCPLDQLLSLRESVSNLPPLLFSGHKSLYPIKNVFDTWKRNIFIDKYLIIRLSHSWRQGSVCHVSQDNLSISWLPWQQQWTPASLPSPPASGWLHSWHQRPSALWFAVLVALDYCAPDYVAQDYVAQDYCPRRWRLHLSVLEWQTPAPCRVLAPRPVQGTEQGLGQGMTLTEHSGRNFLNITDTAWFSDHGEEKARVYSRVQMEMSLCHTVPVKSLDTPIHSMVFLYFWLFSTL